MFVVSDFISTPGLGGAARPPRAAARRGRGAALRSDGNGAAGPRACSSCRMPRPASSCSSTPTTAASASASPPPPHGAKTELRTAFRVAGVDALELVTDDDLVDAILRFADLRKRRSQLATGGGLPQHLGVHYAPDELPVAGNAVAARLVPAVVAVYLVLLRRKRSARAALREPRADQGCDGRRPALSPPRAAVAVPGRADA